MIAYTFGNHDEGCYEKNKKKLFLAKLKKISVFIKI
jgi:hypothetical protein